MKNQDVLTVVKVTAHLGALAGTSLGASREVPKAFSSAKEAYEDSRYADKKPYEIFAVLLLQVIYNAFDKSYSNQKLLEYARVLFLDFKEICNTPAERSVVICTWIAFNRAWNVLLKINF